MEIVFWILLCTIGFIGGVELFSHLFYGLRPLREAARGFLVVRLKADPAAMRGQMEYYLNWIEWNGPGYPVIFLRGEDDIAAKELFGQYFQGFPGVGLVTPEELGGALGLRSD